MFAEMAVAEKPNNNLVDRKNSEYLAQLLNDKKQLQALPNVFVHVEKILDEGRAWFFGRPFVKRFALCHQTTCCLSVCWPDCKPEGSLFSAEFVCLFVCVSLTGTSTLQRGSI